MNAMGKEAKKLLKRIPRTREDFLTIFEKTWRDWLLSPLTWLLHALRITPNAVTIFGGILIAVSVGGYFTDSLSKETQGWLLLAALLTDLIDGPLARNHDMVTVFGIWADHIRDYTWIVWVSYLLYIEGLISLPFIGFLIVLSILYMATLLRGLIIDYLRSPQGTIGYRHFADYTFAHLQATIFGRVQFAAWGLSYIFSLFYLIYGTIILQDLAEISLYVTVVFAAIQVYRGFVKYFEVAA